MFTGDKITHSRVGSLEVRHLPAADLNERASHYRLMPPLLCQDHHVSGTPIRHNFCLAIALSPVSSRGSSSLYSRHDVHDLAVPLLLHDLQSLPHAVEDPSQVDGDDPVLSLVANVWPCLRLFPAHASRTGSWSLANEAYTPLALIVKLCSRTFNNFPIFPQKVTSAKHSGIQSS
jgi:hypothetical protein